MATVQDYRMHYVKVPSQPSILAWHYLLEKVNKLWLYVVVYSSRICVDKAKNDVNSRDPDYYD